MGAKLNGAFPMEWEMGRGVGAVDASHKFVYSASNLEML